MDETRLRNDLCQAAHQLWERGLLVADDGLISVQLHRRSYLVTPPGKRRAALKAGDLPCVDLGGQTLEGDGEIDPISWKPHRMAHQVGEDRLRATVLASPPRTLALLHLLDLEADQLELPGLNPLWIVSPRQDVALRKALRRMPVVVLRGVGVLTAGEDLAAALNAMERIEHAATIQLSLLNHGQTQAAV